MVVRLLAYHSCLLGLCMLDWLFSWIYYGQDGGGPVTCVQRSLVDCVNVVLLVAYASSLLAACARGQWDGIRWGRRRRKVAGAAVSVCCVAVSATYAVTGFRDAIDAAASIVRGLVWVAVAASLHVQPTRPARTVALLWWTLFSLLITAYNAEVLVSGHQLDLAEAVAWPVNFLLSCSAPSIRFYGRAMLTGAVLKTVTACRSL